MLAFIYILQAALLLVCRNSRMFDALYAILSTATEVVATMSLPCHYTNVIVAMPSSLPRGYSPLAPLV